MMKLNILLIMYGLLMNQAVSQSNSYPSFAIVNENNYGKLRKIDLATKQVTTINTAGGACFAISPDGSYLLFIDIFTNAIKKVSFSPFTVNTIIGPASGWSRIDGTGTNAQMNYPRGIAIHPNGLYALIADTANCAIRKLDLSTLYLSTFAGICSGSSPCSRGMVDGATLLTSSFYEPYCIIIHPKGNKAYVYDGSYCTIREITLNEQSTIKTIAGTGTCAYTTNVGPGTSVPIGPFLDIKLISNGNYLIAMDKYVLGGIQILNTLTYELKAIKVSMPGSIISSIDWTGESFLVSDTKSNKIYRLDDKGGNVTVFAGSGLSNTVDGYGTSAAFFYITSIEIWRCMIPGYGISTANMLWERCSAGKYSIEGICVSFPCPTGYNCTPGGSTDPVPCPEKYYCVDAYSISICPAGYYCPIGSSAPILCSEGNICPEGSAMQTPCKEGYYCANTSSSILCNPGYFCPLGSISPIICPVTIFYATSPWGSTNSANCSSPMEGKELSPVNIIFNGTKQDAKFKYTDGRRSASGDKMLFVFTYTNSKNNSITFLRNVSNVEILTVGGGGAGGISLAPVSINGYIQWAGGGGGGGTVLYTADFNPNILSIYDISVGAGGKGVLLSAQQQMWGTDGANGENTEVRLNKTTVLKASGGGGGGQFFGGNGGSGGGSVSDWKGTKDIEAVCPGTYPQTNMFPAVSGIKYACDGARGYTSGVYGYSGGGGGAFIQGGSRGGCPAQGGSGIYSNITGTPLLLAAGGGGFSVGYSCNDASGGIAWNETDPVVIGGSTPGGDGYPNSGSGGASAGTGLKSGSGANGIVIIAWNALLLPCTMNYYKPVDSATACQQCPFGSFTFKEGATACSTCNQGTYPDRTIGICKGCNNTCNASKSKHCMLNSTTVCCGRDTYFVDGFSTACISCTSDTYSTDGSATACITCPPNSKKANLTVNYNCECDLSQGLYLHNTTLNTCLQCPDNYYCPTQETTLPTPTRSLTRPTLFKLLSLLLQKIPLSSPLYKT